MHIRYRAGLCCISLSSPPNFIPLSLMFMVTFSTIENRLFYLKVFLLFASWDLLKPCWIKKKNNKNLKGSKRKLEYCVIFRGDGAILILEINNYLIYHLLWLMIQYFCYDSILFYVESLMYLMIKIKLHCHTKYGNFVKQK